MAIMNMRQWRKAYMLEFLINGAVKDVFTFSVPPESEHFDFPQRITETPTFGGVVIDDYGNDTVKIRLSGSTVNEERKLVYRGNKKPPSYLTGEKEVFELQKIFEEWGDLGNASNKKAYLYDLSKMNFLQTAAGMPARNYWRIVNKGFKIKRDKSKPFTFNYELELTGITDKSPPMEPLFKNQGINNFLDGCLKVIDAIEAAEGIWEGAADVIDTLAWQAADIKKRIEKMKNGNALQNTEAIMRVFPGGEGAWNALKAFMGTASKIAYLAGMPKSQIKGVSNYARGDAFAVFYSSGGGTYIPPERVPYGNCAAEPEEPSRPNFAFKGWFTESGQGFDFAEEITGTITLYAKWEQVLAEVIFNSRQGSDVQPQAVPIGQTAAEPEPPVRHGFVFDHWCTDSAAAVEYDFSAPVTAGITLYAGWKTEYAVTFNSNGGTAVAAQATGVGGKAVYPKTPERENFLFEMWCSDYALTSEYNFDSAVNNSITLYAKWKRVTNNVTFNSNGGTAVAPQAVNIGGYAERPPDPVKEGHAFKHWCSNEGLSQEFLFNSTRVINPIALYAKWEMDAYTVQFEANGGTPVPNQLINFQELAVFPPVPAKDGFIFLRWCGDEALTVEYDFSAPVTGNTVLYADWHEGAA